MLTLRPSQLNKYLKLDQQGKIMAEYVWIDSTGGTRSKSRVCTTSSLRYLDPCRLHCASSCMAHATPPICPGFLVAGQRSQQDATRSVFGVA